MRLTVLLIAFFLPTQALALGIQTCFTPGQDCTRLIVQEIDGAKHELLVQAYTFTSAPIVQAIARAQERGVKVGVILDKTNEQKRYTGATYLLNHNVIPLIDFRPAIAHNKVIVLDERTVITGSFNFTVAAQKRNAENVLIVSDDPRTASAYADNWRSRAAVSRPYKDFRQSHAVSTDLKD